MSMAWLGICLVAIAFFYGRHQLARRRVVGPKAVTTSFDLQERHTETNGTFLPEYDDNLHVAATASPPPYTPQT
jgi:hypothetical protein